MKRISSRPLVFTGILVLMFACALPLSFSGATNNDEVHERGYGSGEGKATIAHGRQGSYGGGQGGYGEEQGGNEGGQGSFGGGQGSYTGGGQAQKGYYAQPSCKYGCCYPTQFFCGRCCERGETPP